MMESIDDSTSAKLASLVGRGHLYKGIRRNGSVLGFEPSKITIAMTNAYVNAAEAVLAQVLGVLNKVFLKRRLDALIAFARCSLSAGPKQDRDQLSRLALSPDFHGALNPAAP